MKIKQFNIYLATLTLKKPFKHGSFERNFNKTIFLKLVDENGNKGYGESLPRNYVTGESLGWVVNNLKRYSRNIPDKFNGFGDLIDFLDNCENENSRNMSALCGLDMALIDLYGKNTNQSLSEMLESEGYRLRTQNPRISSGPLGLGASNLKKSLYCLLGFNDIKLKIDSDTNPDKINEIWLKGIKPKTLRLDGNCSLTPKRLQEILEDVKVPIDYIEQAFKVGVSGKIPGFKSMADESLVSIEDAKTIDFDAASVRIGKNGGIVRSLRIIKELENRGIDYMIGSLVGETSLLSAGLLHLARITNPFLVEGCYSTRLLKKDPVNKSIKLGYKGDVKFNYSKPGLGVELDLMGIKSLVL